MKDLPYISNLTDQEKNVLIALLWKEFQSIRQHVEELEKHPKQTSLNSSKLPSQGFKSNKQKNPKGGERRAASVGRVDGGCSLHLHSHQTVTAYVHSCPGCGSSIPEAGQKLHSRYDKLELPPIGPIVTQVERYQIECPRCKQQVVAAVSAHLAPGTPFGETIEP